MASHVFVSFPAIEARSLSASSGIVGEESRIRDRRLLSEHLQGRAASRRSFSNCTSAILSNFGILPNFSSDDASPAGSSVKINPSRLSSALLVSFLVNYSVIVSDWWQFKHTAKDRFLTTAVPQAASLLPKGLLPADFGSSLKEDLVSDDESTLTVDDLDSSIIWEQTKKDVDAEVARGPVSSPGFSFSAAGLLFPYHLGAVQFLQEAGIIHENTPVAGASAGALVCATIASGVDMRRALHLTKKLAADCRENGTAFRLGPVLRSILEEILPHDAHKKCSGRIRVAVTRVLKSPRGQLVDMFDSKEDLINALITSSFVPGYLEPRPATRFRNELCVDGGLSMFMPPTSAPHTVRICAFPASALGLGNVGISPDLNPEGRSSMRQLFSWALEPAEDKDLDLLFAQGYQDAQTWVTQNLLTLSSSATPSRAL